MTNHEKATRYLTKLALLGLKPQFEIMLMTDDRVSLENALDRESDKVIKVPNFITDINSCAFSGCEHTEVHIDNSPNNILNIDNAFGYMASTKLKLRIAHPEQIRSLYGSFSDMYNLTSIDFGNMRFKNVKNISNIFAGCRKLEKINISCLENAPLVDIGSAFFDCTNLEEIMGIGSLDVSRVINMSSIFYNCSRLNKLNISNWDTKSVTNMQTIFAGCKSLRELHIENWNVSNVKCIDAMFAVCRSLIELDISKWDIGNIYKMREMFLNCKNLKQLELPEIPGDREVLTQRMYAGCSRLNRGGA